MLFVVAVLYLSSSPTSQALIHTGPYLRAEYSSLKDMNLQAFEPKLAEHTVAISLGYRSFNAHIQKRRIKERRKQN